jgi:hypothetical protein
MHDLEETGDVDFGYEIPGVARYRANFFNQKYGVGAVFRQIPSKVLSFEDFERFDLVLAMDGSNLAELKARAPHEARGKIRPFLDFAPHVGTKDVPDPFFGGAEGFDHVLDLIEAASRGLLASLTGKEKVRAKRGA